MRLSVMQASIDALSQGDASPVSNDLTMHSSEDSESSLLTTREEEIDTFDLRPQAGNSVSLSSQLMSLGEIVGAGSLSPPCPPSYDKLRPAGSVLAVQLPNFEFLQDLTGVFFRDMNVLIPMMNQGEAVPRITRTLRSLGYNERTGMINCCTSSSHIVFLGTILNILAIADTDTPGFQSQIQRSGWNWFQQGQRLSRYFAAMKPGDIDGVCFYTLGAVYLLRLELLSHASHYVMQAWNAAAITGMNNQSSWPPSGHSTNSSRQKLWWALYYVDAHIARRRGRPYLIRDIEVVVSEFLPRLSLGENHAQAAIPVHEYLLSLENTNIRDMEYYQTSLNFGRLWRQIWDTLFSARLGRSADAHDVEILDARILFLERITPSRLRLEEHEDWFQQTLEASEVLARRRLFCQLQLNLFRMIIRQNPIRKTKAKPHDGRICAALGRKNVSMCAAYMAAYPDSLRSAANVLTAHIGETLYHFTYALCDANPQLDASAVIDSFTDGYGLLKKLARDFHGPRKALNAITTSYCALKRTVLSSTLGRLVDFIRKEHEAAINAAANGDTMTAQQQDGISDVSLHLPHVSKPPSTDKTNDAPGTGAGLDQDFGSEELGFQWPVMSDIDLNILQDFEWPELEISLANEDVQR
ncbi:hypothetical protein CERZMDRAFT_107379 [Cercospora zeae-maydis SCOH1-5]|uniref:Transcription factor domain-containing protein n=1 Tax=Cercospora zeae-maydis SCOH1-5 TaxID=717836 RepID=A0A6A6F5S7_9PEZI|nr:hypothetical protein CERZMDRAFT_107379 [Cercospora zeae-maydis SCOH1-5]